MPDSSSSSTSSSTGGSPQPRSTFNRAQLEDLETAEDIVTAARRDAYKTALAAREITTAVVDRLAQLCLAARRKTARTVQDDTASEAQTLNASGIERQIVLAIQEIQAAAKQKYARREPVQLQNFFVGQRVNPNEATLHQIAFTIAERLTPVGGTDLATAPDRLPGIVIDKINRLRTLIGLPAAGTGGSSSSTSSSSSSSSSGTAIVTPEAAADRAMRDAMVHEINDRRMEIQFAADGLWPYTDPTNATARASFHLPHSRPFSG